MPFFVLPPNTITLPLWSKRNGPISPPLAAANTLVGHDGVGAVSTQRSGEVTKRRNCVMPQKALLSCSSKQSPSVLIALLSYEGPVVHWLVVGEYRYEFELT